MARYVKEYRQKDDPQVSFQLISQYLIGQGFKYKNYKGEDLFQKGNGWLVAPSFVKITYGPGTVRFETWISGAILPGVFAGEYGYDGFVGCAVKGTIKSVGQQMDFLLGGPAYALTVGQDIKPGQPLTPVAYSVPIPGTVQQPQPIAQNVVAPTGVWYCSKCGTRVAPGTNFCNNCGNRVN